MLDAEIASTSEPEEEAVERSGGRQSWIAEGRDRIVGESGQESVSAVARRHGHIGHSAWRTLPRLAIP